MTINENKLVYIYCDGGFGNRFNSLVSGLSLAKSLEREPLILWPQNNWCMAAFDELFDCKFGSSSQTIQGLLAQNNTVNIFHENQFSNELVWTHYEHVDIALLKNSDSHVLYYSSLIASWVNMQHLETEILPKLKFKYELVFAARTVIDENISTGNRFFGIHLRKTDFGNSNEVDTASLAMIRSRPNDVFFVCSDDADTEIRFSKEQNVFVHKKTSYVEKLVQGDWNSWITDSNNQNWPFNVNRSSDSVKQALIDLLILSQSDIVPTNTRSTFLQTAYLLKSSFNQFSE